MTKAVLESQTLGEIVSILRESARNNRGHDLRKAARMQVQARVLMARWASGAPGSPGTIIARDLSASGVGFMTGVNFAKEDELVLLLPRNRNTYESVLAKVVFASEAATGIYTVGAEFIEQLPSTTTQELLQFFLNSSAEGKKAIEAKAASKANDAKENAEAAKGSQNAKGKEAATAAK
jgi:hypothetical protein